MALIVGKVRSMVSKATKIIKSIVMGILYLIVALTFSLTFWLGLFMTDSIIRRWLV